MRFDRANGEILRKGKEVRADDRRYKAVIFYGQAVGDEQTDMPPPKRARKDTGADRVF